MMSGNICPYVSSTSEVRVMLQVIDDSIGNTLVAASTLTPEIREKLNGGGGGNTVRGHSQLNPPILSCLWVLANVP